MDFIGQGMKASSSQSHKMTGECDDQMVVKFEVQFDGSAAMKREQAVDVCKELMIVNLL